MRSLEVIVCKGFSRDELILILSRIRQRPVSIPTFYRWLDQASITPKSEYSNDEAKQLAKLARHFARGGKTKNLHIC